MSPATAQRAPAQSLDRNDLDRVAGEIVLKHGARMLEDAIRYSSNRSDAEDAYQRSLEILLEKAPTTDPDELVPWLRTVVKHEALAIARERRRELVGVDTEMHDAVDDSWLPPEDAAESMSELAMGVEALQRLTLDQARCLVAQSNGLTYDQISQATGFTRRKVTRCLENGRNAFARQLDEIASGSECQRVRPLMHRVLDGDSAAAIELRPHLRHCVACRARFRTYESAPRRVAVLFPPALVAVSGGRTGAPARVAEWVQSIGDRLVAPLLGADRWVEVATAKKIIAVATIAAAATGSVAVRDIAVDESRTKATDATRGTASSGAALRGAFDRVRVAPVVRPAERRDRQRHKAGVVQPPAPKPALVPAPRPQTSPRVDDGSLEFAPGAPDAP